MDYKVVSQINISNECEKVGQFQYDRKKDALYFDGPWPFPVQIAIEEGLSKCYVTPGFLKLPFILRGWINLDILLREIDLMKMALCGRLMLHASCVDDTLIVGFPNSGKTYQTMKMLRDGGSLISEEYTLVENGEAMPYKPVTRTCISNKTLRDSRWKITWKQRIQLCFTTIRAWLMPFMFEDVIWIKLWTCGRKSKIKKIVYGSTGQEIKDYRQLIILTENEFPFMANDFLQAYALMSGLDLIDIQERQRKLIKEFFNVVYPSAKP